MPLALFGITNDTLNLVVNLLILSSWSCSGSRSSPTPSSTPGAGSRTRFLVVCATAASFVFPFVGTIVYSILRPPEFLDDQHERELEIRAAELRLRQLEEQSCPHCEHPIERSFLRCPNCRAANQGPLPSPAASRSTHAGRSAPTARRPCDGPPRRSDAPIRSDGAAHARAKSAVTRPPPRASRSRRASLRRGRPASPPDAQAPRDRARRAPRRASRARLSRPPRHAGRASRARTTPPPRRRGP